MVITATTSTATVEAVVTDTEPMTLALTCLVVLLNALSAATVCLGFKWQVGQLDMNMKWKRKVI